MSAREETIQIVSFSTNNTNCNPNDIFNILLEQYTHTIVKKSRHIITFTLVLPDTVQTTKIMMCSILNLNREYTGITDVNCYLIFIDLQCENSKDSFDSILSYAQNYCDLNKKIYALGIFNKENDTKQKISKGDIKKIMDSGKLNYEYIEINLVKKEEVADILLNILSSSSKEFSREEGKTEDKQANSCIVL